MIRKIIKIDENKCNGCGACAEACHEGAIEMVGGKAVLTREDYCDGLGDCLPACPMDAISFEEREAPEYDEAAVLRAKKQKSGSSCPSGGGGGFTCPGHALKTFKRDDASTPRASSMTSKLSQWPCQIKLVPVNAPYFDGANLLVAAGCTAFAYGNFHEDFMRNHITLIGCPKLDMVDYSEKLTEVFKYNNIRSITVARMTVPCCGGLSHAVKTAVANSGKNIPLHIVTISPDGRIIK